MITVTSVLPPALAVLAEKMAPVMAITAGRPLFFIELCIVSLYFLSSLDARLSRNAVELSHRGREALDLLPSDSPTVVWLQPAEGVSNVDHGLVRQGIDVLRPSNADNYLFVRDPEGRVIGFHEPARESR